MPVEEPSTASISESHVRGSTETPLIESTIGSYFDEATDRFVTQDALVVRHQGIRWTYGELRKQVDAFAAGLLALGLKPGDRVGIWSPNNAEWVITQFATAKAGLILVNIFEQNAVLQGLVPALDLALGLRMIRGAAYVLHAFAFEPLG